MNINRGKPLPETLYGYPVVLAEIDHVLPEPLVLGTLPFLDEKWRCMLGEFMLNIPQAGDVCVVPPGAMRYEGVTENADGTQTLRFTILDEPQPDVVIEGTP